MLDDIMYVVCGGPSTIHLYNKDTYSPLGVVIKVDGMKRPHDIVVSDRQLYIADYKYYIWRVSVDDHSYVKWLSTKSTTDTFYVHTLSVTSQRLLVTSKRPPSLRQYNTTDGQLLRVVELPGYMEKLHHSVETTRGTFVIGHGHGSPRLLWQDTVRELFRFRRLLVILITYSYFDNTKCIILVLQNCQIAYFCHLKIAIAMLHYVNARHCTGSTA